MKIIRVDIADRHELLKCYIQQFKFGGIFIKGKFNFTLGTKVLALITLRETNEQLGGVNATVGWISGESTIGYPQGVGVQFNNDPPGLKAKTRIEQLLGTALNKDYDSYVF